MHILFIKKAHKILFILSVLIYVPFQLIAQDDLLDLLDEDDQEETSYTYGTFKGTRIVNTFSTDIQPKGELQFIITHRFGNIKDGAHNFFGLDNATMRIGFEYGLTDRWAMGFGRTAIQETFDFFSKYKLLKQSKGKVNMPVSMVWHINTAIRAEEFTTDTGTSPGLNERLFLTNQLFISRKFSPKLSLQITPTHTRNSMMEVQNESTDVFHLGIGGRMSLSNRMAILIDYYKSFDDNLKSDFNEALGVALEIETGGHVFHLIFTNSQGLNEKLFLTRTTGDFFGGDLHFGFNLSRTFAFGKKH